MSLVRYKVTNSVEQLEVNMERYAQEAHMISPFGNWCNAAIGKNIEDQSKVFEAAKLLKDLIAHIF